MGAIEKRRKGKEQPKSARDMKKLSNDSTTIISHCCSRTTDQSVKGQRCGLHQMSQQSGRNVDFIFVFLLMKISKYSGSSVIFRGPCTNAKA